MNNDVTKYTYSIILPEDAIQTPKECISVFNGITYNKGGAILYMIDNFMGHQAFIDATKELLKRFYYSNANGDDLVETFTPFYDDGYSGISNFSAFFQSWLNLAGIPVLSVDINIDEKILD